MLTGCPLGRPVSVRCLSVLFARRNISALNGRNETCDRYSSCEWTLLKRCSRSEVKVRGQGHSEVICTSSAERQLSTYGHSRSQLWCTGRTCTQRAEKKFWLNLRGKVVSALPRQSVHPQAEQKWFFLKGNWEIWTVGVVNLVVSPVS